MVAVSPEVRWCLSVKGSRGVTMSRKNAVLSAVATEPVTQVYVSPRELMKRWQCSRSQVDRIAKREQFTRLLLGRGRNGMVRYVWAEVLTLEAGAKA